MKKLFISCPMREKNKDEIKKIRKNLKNFAEELIGEKLEAVNSYIEDKPPSSNNEAVWMLGKSIELMSQADFYIGINCTADKDRECFIKNEVAELYDLEAAIISEEYVL